MEKDFKNINELAFSKKDIYGNPVDLSQVTNLDNNKDIILRRRIRYTKRRRKIW